MKIKTLSLGILTGSLLASVAVHADCPNLTGTYFGQESKTYFTVLRKDCTEIDLGDTTLKTDGTSQKWSDMNDVTATYTKDHKLHIHATVVNGVFQNFIDDIDFSLDDQKNLVFESVFSDVNGQKYKQPKKVLIRENLRK